MKFTIEKNVLLGALVNTVKALSQKVTIPVLNGIKFNLTKKGLELLASDSELTIKVVIPEKEIKKVEKEGSAIIQSKNLIEVVKKMPSDDIHFEYVENKIRIYTETNEFYINCYPIEEYPNFKLEENKKNIKVNSIDLKEIIHQTSYAMSNQE